MPIIVFAREDKEAKGDRKVEWRLRPAADVHGQLRPEHVVAARIQARVMAARMTAGLAIVFVTIFTFVR